jgi:glycosyltransferase 2 family protein
LSQPDATPAARKGSTERKVIIGVVVGALVYAGVVLYADVDALRGALTGYEWWTFGAALGLVSVGYALRWAKWEIYLRILGIRLPLARSILAFLAGFVMTVTPGKVGEVVKSVLLRQSDGIPVARTAPVVLAERLTDLIALIVLAAMGIGTYQYGATALLAVSALVVAGVVVLSWERGILAGLAAIGRLPLGAKVAPKLQEAYVATRILLRLRPLLITTAISIGAWGLEAVAFVLIVRGFGPVDPALSAPLGAGGFVYAMTTIIGAVSFLPGGLGVTEAGMISALQVLEIVSLPAVASAASILARLATLWWAVVVGVVAFAAYQRLYLRDRTG